MNVSQPGRSPAPSDIPQPEQVLKDPRCLYPHISKTEGRMVFDSLPYSVYALRKDIRDYLISAPLRPKLRVRHNIAAFNFSKPELSVSDHDCRVLMKEAVDKKNPQQTPDNTLTWRVSNQSGDQVLRLIRHDSDDLYELKAPKPAQNNELLAVYNRSDEQIITLTQGTRRFTLKAHGGLVLKARKDERGQLQWQVVSKYTPTMKTTDTNPLVVDAIDPGAQVAVRGEILLPPAMIRSLVQSDIKPVVCTWPEQICSHFHELNASEADSRSMIIFSNNSNHIVAVRGQVCGNDVYLYIHETLEPDHPIAQSMRNDIIKAAQSAFARRNLHVLTPDFKTQNDFSCCSVFTLDAINWFESEPELDRWLAKQCQNEATLVWQGKGLERVFRSRKEQGEAPVTLPEGCYLDVKTIPSELLRLSQNSKLKYSPEQLRATVGTHPDTGKTLSLEEYFALHSPSYMVDGKEKQQPHLAASGLRYQQLLRWGKDQKLLDIAEPVMVTIPGQVRESKKVVEEFIESKPSDKVAAGQKRKPRKEGEGTRRKSLKISRIPRAKVTATRKARGKSKVRPFVLDRNAQERQRKNKLIKATQVLRDKLFPDAPGRVPDIQVIERASALIDEKEEEIIRLQEKVRQLEKKHRVKRW